MIQNTAEKRKWLNILGAALLLAAVIEQMFISTTKGWDSLLHIVYTYGLAAQFAFIVICALCVKNNSFAVKCMVAFFAWFVATRPLLGDLDLTESMLMLTPTALNVSILCYAASLGTNQRKKLLSILSTVICLFYFGVCIGVLYVAITRTRTFLPLYIEILLKEEGGLRYADLRASHRNFSAQWYCLCFCLSACQLYLSRKKVIKALWAIMMLVFYTCVAISLSRISMLALAMAIGMMLAVIVLKRVSGKKMTAQVSIAVVVVLISTILVYKSYDYVGAAVGKISLSVTPIEQTAVDNTDSDAGQTDIEDENVPTVIIEDGDTMFTETRGKENTMMLGGRVLVWKSVYYTLRFEPWRLRFGGLMDDYMSAINRIIAQTDPAAVVPNTHNYFIEVLMLTGLPGLLLVAAFTLLLLVRMVKVFFSPSAEVLPKLLTIPLAANLLKSLGEATLIWQNKINNDITNYIFFLVAGMFLAYSYELFPEKRVGRKTKSVDEASM